LLPQVMEPLVELEAADATDVDTATVRQVVTRTTAIPTVIRLLMNPPDSSIISSFEWPSW
jgi:hypothetical protein